MRGCGGGRRGGKGRGIKAVRNEGIGREGGREGGRERGREKREGGREGEREREGV